VNLRRSHPIFRRRRFFAGDTGGGDSSLGDIAWFTPGGEKMTNEDWSRGHAHSVMVFLNGDAIPEPGRRGERVFDDSFLIAFNAHHEPTTVTIPGTVYGDGWLVQLDTSDDQAGIVSVFEDATTLIPGLEFSLTERSIVILRRPRTEV